MNIDDIIKDKKVLSAFEQFTKLLLEWNQRFNLTAITDTEQIKIKHFVDSLAALDYIKGNVLDIGAGAGFPSLPLAIVKKDSFFCLVDSVNKKVSFLNHVIKELSLNNVTALHKRAEDLDKSTLYDTVVSRGVAELRTLCEYCLPFVKLGGTFIAYKSDKTDEEIINAQNAINILGGKIDNVITKQISPDITRRLILIKKIKPSDSKYPRGGNRARLNPL